MLTWAEPRIVLVTRPTRLAELVVRFNTVAQARFVLERLGADFDDYREEDLSYGAALAETRRQLARHGRVAAVERRFLPSFLFSRDDLVVVLGPDGLVANTLKYLDGQPVLGVNPDPQRWDSHLLPFGVGDLGRILPEALVRRRPIRQVTMAQAALNNGQTLLAVNDLFIGVRNHGSARYRIRIAGRSEDQSSSGVIVSTGLGATGWLRSLLAGAWALSRQASMVFAQTGSAPESRAPRWTAGQPVAAIMGGANGACNGPEFGSVGDLWQNDPGYDGPSCAEGVRGCDPDRAAPWPGPVPPTPHVPWDTDRLYFTVREPFPSRGLGISLVFGRVTADEPLVLVSQTAENGVIFSDGLEQDFLEFNAGTRATVTLAERKGLVMV